MISWRSQIDRDIYEKILIPVLRDQPTTVFIGAGLSKHAGYPLVNDLINLLHSHAQEHTGKQIDLIGDWKDRAQICKSELGDANFNQILIEIFNPENNKLNFTSIHTHLVEIPFKSIITTNYDSCIELALSALNKARTLFYYPGLNSSELGNNSIQHIHGYINPENPHDTVGSVILTSDDFAQAYRDRPGSVRRFLIDLFSNQNVIFIGFNMNDKVLTDDILNAVREALAEKQNIANSRHLPPIEEKRHFAIMENSAPVDEINGKILDAQEKEILIREQDVKVQSLGVYPIRYNVDPLKYHKSVESIIVDMKNIMAIPALKRAEAGDII